MADDYRKGADAASTDFPRNRLASRALGQLAKNAFGLLPGAQAREQEFMDGYRDTHRMLATDEQRFLQTKIVPSSPASSQPPNSSSGSPTMSRRDLVNRVSAQSYGITSSGGGVADYNHQMELLMQLIAYLQSFEDGMQDAQAGYRQRVEELGQEMMVQDHRHFLEEHLQPAESLLNGLRALLINESVPYLQRKIDALRNAMDQR
jgi:hypothetical protein